ncbi:MAG: hypothetical protein GX813_03480 [Erysipelotrichia bacterium]|nr:hypothetical protein [Erysipelotrichia bacterium]
MKRKRSIVNIIAATFFVCAMFLSTFVGNNDISLKRAAPLNANVPNEQLHISTLATSVSSHSPAITSSGTINLKYLINIGKLRQTRRATLLRNG